MNNKMLPREKALNFGISSLEDKELLALIIKTGYKEKPINSLIDEIIEKVNGFDNLLSLNYEELISIKGIKNAKALEILAILEIAKRLSKPKDHIIDILDNNEKVVNWCRCNIAFSLQEEFFIIYLNNSGGILKFEKLFIGSENASIISINEIIRRAIILKAQNIIVAHNHPSNNPKPSKEDIYITEKLNNSLKMMNIRLLDHIIITKYSHFSFNSHNLI